MFVSVVEKCSPMQPNPIIFKIIMGPNNVFSGIKGDGQRQRRHRGEKREIFFYFERTEDTCNSIHKQRGTWATLFSFLARTVAQTRHIEERERERAWIRSSFTTPSSFFFDWYGLTD